MTACKDSQATSGKKAVSATLAGVLAVGLVPAVALADEAVEVTEEDGITELNATIGQEFNGGTISKINLNGCLQPGEPGRDCGCRCGRELVLREGRQLADCH